MVQINEVALDKLRELNSSNDGDFALEMLEFFLAKVPETKIWMNALDRDLNFKEALNHFHALKSSSAVIGLTSVSQSAAQLEAFVRDQNYSDCLPAFENLKKKFEESCVVVRQYITSSQKSK